jgi:hypothetical protein
MTAMRGNALATAEGEDMMSIGVTGNIVARLLAFATVLVFPAATGNTYEVTGRQVQDEQRWGDQITVEASIIHHIYCNGRRENGGRYFIYQYTNRPGFRAILPPYWGDAIGGRDWRSFERAASVACRQRSGV